MLEVSLRAIGAVLGYKEMMRSLLPNIAAWIAILSFGLPAIPIIAVVGFLTGKRALSNVGKAIREKVVGEFQSKLRQESGNQADTMSEKLDAQLNELEKNLDVGMQKQIDEIKEQMNAALKDKEKGQAEVNRKIKNIENIRKNLRSIHEEVSAFMIELLNIERN